MIKTKETKAETMKRVKKAPAAEPAPLAPGSMDPNEASDAEAAKPAAKAKSAAKSPAKKKAVLSEDDIGDKAAVALKMLRRKNGATAADIAERNDWLLHTTRAWIATYPRKLGLTVEKTKSPGEATVYKIEA
jgi:hypothetical protein